MPKQKKYFLQLVATGVVFSFCVSFVRATTVIVPLLETPSAIVITPSSSTIGISDTQQLIATAIFTTGSPDLDITCSSFTTWTSDNSAIASVNTNDVDDNDGCDELSGLATGASNGTVNVTATYGGVTGSAVLNVTSPPSPTPPSSSGGGSGSSSPGPTPSPTPSPAPAPTPTPTPSPTPESPSPQPSPTPAPPAPGEEQFAPSPEGELPPVVTVTPPTPPPEEVLPVTSQTETQEIEVPITEPPLVIQTELGPVFISPELSVTRGEILQRIRESLDIENRYQDLLESCVADLKGCLSIFTSVTQFPDVTPDGVSFPNHQEAPTAQNVWLSLFDKAFAAPLFELGALQLYPDVPPDHQYAYAINIATMLSIVQGYYEEARSPFKPYQIITKMEAVKVLLGSVGLMKWLYYDELETTFGGPEGVKSQKTPFADVNASRDSMWWYPRYLHSACEIGLIDCTPGSNFRPDEFITEAELEEMIARLKNYLEKSDFIQSQTADPDNDGLKTYIENTVYFTNPLVSDTDNDQLRDSEEVKEYSTSPFLTDTDAEGLSDYDEVKMYKTDPLKIDTDGDEHSDSEEIRFKSDPLDPDSFPLDANGNGIADAWEEEYNLTIQDGMVDTDLDGVSDKIEYQIGSNPLLPDSDNDGFSDAQEILELRTDPMNPNDPGTLENIGVRITNFQEYQPIGDSTPLIKGIAPLNTKIRILLRNDFGHEKILGDTSVDENSIFIFQVDQAIRDGRYQLVARVLDDQKQTVTDSKPVHIIIDSTLHVPIPSPKKLADKDLTEEVFLKNLRIEIRDKKPVLVGETEFGSKVTATWRSVVTTSALIADSTSGEFMIAAPIDLPLGGHEVFVNATRRKDNAQSDTVKVFFTVSTALPITEVLKGAAEAPPGGFGAFADFVTQRGPLFWIVVSVFVLLSGAGAYYLYLSKKKQKS